MTTEWHRRGEFAEFAEALGVPTDQVMAVEVTGDPMIVLYTLERDVPDPWVWAVGLRRDGDGLLRDALLPRRLTRISRFLEGPSA